MSSSVCTRPLRKIEEAAIIRYAEQRYWRCRRIGPCLLFIHSDDPGDMIILSRQTLRWRETIAFGEGVGLVSLVHRTFGWSTKDAIDRMAKRRRSERRREELRHMLTMTQEYYRTRRASEDAQWFMRETRAIIKEYGQISRATLRIARDKFIWEGLGYDQRLDELYDRVPVGASAEFYQAIHELNAHVAGFVK